MKHFAVLAASTTVLLALSGFGEPTRAAHPDDAPADATCDAVWFSDADGDGYGILAEAVVACHAPDGFAALPGDCDDVHADVNPAATETCNGRDDDCNGTADDAMPLWFVDRDGDGWGDRANTWSRCDQPVGYAARAGDCDDRDGARFPGRGCRG